MIHEKELIGSDLYKMLKNSPAAPVFTSLSQKNCWGIIKTCTTLESYLGSIDKWPEPIRTLKAQDAEYAIQSLGMTIAFLEEALLSDTTIPTADF